MKVVRATEAQVRAIRNLMVNQDQIQIVLDRLETFGTRWIKDLDIGQAKELISDLIENMQGWKS